LIPAYAGFNNMKPAGLTMKNGSPARMPVGVPLEKIGGLFPDGIPAIGELSPNEFHHGLFPADEAEHLGTTVFGFRFVRTQSFEKFRNQFRLPDDSVRDGVLVRFLPGDLRLQ
jgi:hypothetical protein